MKFEEIRMMSPECHKLNVEGLSGCSLVGYLRLRRRAPLPSLRSGLRSLRLLRGTTHKFGGRLTKMMEGVEGFSGCSLVADLGRWPRPLLGINRRSGVKMAVI